MNRRFRGFPYHFRRSWFRPRFLAFRGSLGWRGALLPSNLADFNAEQFQTELTDIEATVQKLRQYFDEICRIHHQQQALNQRRTHPALPAAELQALQQQLDALETELISATLPWQTLAAPFWQAIRFGGLGLVMGWVLKGIVQGQ